MCAFEVRTGDRHGHGAEVAGCLVQVQPVALEQQVHVGLAEVVCSVPEVEGAIGDPVTSHRGPRQYDSTQRASVMGHKG